MSALRGKVKIGACVYNDIQRMDFTYELFNQQMIPCLGSRKLQSRVCYYKQVCEVENFFFLIFPTFSFYKMKQVDQSSMGGIIIQHFHFRTFLSQSISQNWCYTFCFRCREDLALIVFNYCISECSTKQRYFREFFSFTNRGWYSTTKEYSIFKNDIYLQ